MSLGLYTLLNFAMYSRLQSAVYGGAQRTHAVSSFKHLHAINYHCGGLWIAEGSGVCNIVKQMDRYPTEYLVTVTIGYIVRRIGNSHSSRVYNGSQVYNSW